MGYKRGFKFLNSKKGMDIELWFNVFELVVVFLVGIVLLDLVNSEAKGNAFEKNYFARDSALLINTIYAGQGDIEYNYPDKTDNYAFDFRSSGVAVYLQNEPSDTASAEYQFAEDKNYDFIYKKTLPPSIKLIYKKAKKSIEIIDVHAYNPPRSGNYGGGGATVTY